MPPGRYALSPLDDTAEITFEEDAAIRRGLDELEAGDVVPLDQVIREYKSHPHRS